MKIHNKLSLVLFSFSLLLVTALVVLMQWSIGRGMIEYVNTKEVEALAPLAVKFQKIYEENKGWGTIKNDHKLFRDLVFQQLKNSQATQLNKRPISLSSKNNLHEDKRRADRPSMESRRPPPREGDRRPPPEFDPSYETTYALLDHKGKVVAGYYLKDTDHSKIEITVDKVAVGFLAISIRNQINAGYELDFLEQQQSYLWLIAVIAMVLFTLVTLPLSRHLVQPIKLIIHGMHKLTQGEYNQQVSLKRKDEMGDLIRDFNELSLTLDKNENARKRWLANISHELRTPVAILRGELEAMIDNVRPLSKENINSANDEVKHLQHLIDDLHQLTSADIGGMHYRKQNENLSLWLNSEINKYRSYLSDASIELDVEIDYSEVNAFVDSTRLCQLFDNIINNCIKYSQASLAKISLEIDKKSTTPLIIIKVQDDGVGVEEQHLVNLFEHLYRVEDSRNRKTGGSGLGLSICAHIVAAHKGTISAEKSDLGGLAIVITLPYEHS